MKIFDRSSLSERLSMGRLPMSPSTEWEQKSSKSVVAAREPSSFVAQQVAPLFYRDSKRQDGEDYSFKDEAAFWRASSELALAVVGLKKFRVSDWFPRAPGVYWSRDGERARNYVFTTDPHHDEALGDYYAPASKLQLIEQGGIGTIRLTPKVIDGEPCQLAVAMVGSQCAGGVPLAIPKHLLRSSDFTWGDTVDIEGEVRLLKDVGLDDAAAYVHHAAPIIVFVHQIEAVAKREKRNEPMIITPVVLFSTEVRDGPARRRAQESYSYSFVHCTPSSSIELDDAADWMTRYAAKHKGRVITNFDEMYPTLADAPLSYQRLVRGEYDATYIETLHVHGPLKAIIEKVGQMNSTNSVTLGNGVVIHGNLTVAGSIKDSFNRSESVGDPDLRNLLTKLSSQVGEILGQMQADVAKQVADDLEALTKELARPAPRKKWWQLSVAGIEDAAVAVGSIGKPVVETVKLLLPLLDGV
jgi:hypothetical protein